MPKYLLVDLATGKTAQGKALPAVQRQALLSEGSKLLGEVFEVKPRAFKSAPLSQGMHLLALLANNSPISVWYYNIKAEPSGRRIAFSHFVTKAGAGKPYFQAKGETPAVSLFKWMRRCIGKDTRLAFAQPTLDGARLVRSLERKGFLRQTATGYRDEFELVPKPKMRRVRRML